MRKETPGDTRIRTGAMDEMRALVQLGMDSRGEWVATDLEGTHGSLAGTLSAAVRETCAEYRVSNGSVYLRMRTEDELEAQNGTS